MSRPAHPDRRAFDLAKRKISAQIRREFPDVEYIAGVGYTGPKWQEATARDAELRRSAAYLRLEAVAGVAPLYQEAM